MHTHLTRVHLKGFRNIQDTETTFREGLNIIIGPNGCGKTNFLWLLANIDSEETNQIGISAEIEILDYLPYQVYEKNKIIITNQRPSDTRFYNKIEKKILYFVENNEVASDSAEAKIMLHIIFRTFLPFNISNEIEHFSTPKLLFMGIDNRYFAPSTTNTVLFSLLQIKNYTLREQNFRLFKMSDLNFEQKTIDILKQYTPIQDIRVEYPQREDEIKQTNTEIQISNLMYGFKTNNEWFKWNELSDGTRRIAWIVLNILLTNSKIILIEEPELGIHPHQLARLMDFIKDQSAHKQIIITTHSPEVLDILESDELDRIKIARYDEARGTTVIEGLSDKKIALIQKYIQKTSLLSNYWSNIGLENTKKSF